MCTGRIDLTFISRAFAKGADGVIIGGCWPGECHYVTEGNYDALGNMHLFKKLLQRIGLDPSRLRLEWIAASEGSRFAEVMSSFTTHMTGLGALGTAEGEGLDPDTLRLKLLAVDRLLPYLKLVEREKLRVPERTEDAINSYFDSDEVNRVFDDLIADRLAVSQILLLLAEGPASSGEIAERLGLTASSVNKHMNRSSRQGLVRFDAQRGAFALA